MRRSPLTAFVLACAALFVGGCAGAGGAADGTSDRASRPAAAPAAVKVATFPGFARLVPSVSVEGAPSTIELQAARGEREAAQLVAWAVRGTPRVGLSRTSLIGAGGRRIAEKHVRVSIEQPMLVERGSPAGRSGEFYEPLLPAARRAVVLGSEARLAIWVDVEVPLKAAPGTYSGSVEVRRADADGILEEGDDGLLARVPLSLRVRGATIPKRPTLDSSIGVDASQLLRFEPEVQAGSAELRALMQEAGDTLADARLSIADVGTLPPGTLASHGGLAGDEEYLERMFGQRGAASARIPFYMDYPFADPLGRDRPAAVAYLRAAARWLRSRGLLDRAYVYAIDEPDRSRGGEVRELWELVREADPELRLLVTRESTAPELRGSVDIWAPNISARTFRVADVVRERRAGRDTWWYPSVTTWQPQPSLFVDDVRPSPRALGWLAWRYGVRGLLYWSATHWHEVNDPWKDSATYRETDAVGNGDGVLLYPGSRVGLRGRLLPGVRLLQLRDGIEDHDLLTLASCAATPAERMRLDSAARAAAPSMTLVAPTQQQVEALREAAFSVLERAGVPDPCRAGA